MLIFVCKYVCVCMVSLKKVVVLFWWVCFGLFVLLLFGSFFFCRNLYT